MSKAAKSLFLYVTDKMMKVISFNINVRKFVCFLIVCVIATGFLITKFDLNLKNLNKQLVDDLLFIKPIILKQKLLLTLRQNWNKQEQEKYCQASRLWIRLNERIYFKRSLGYYFMDKMIFRTFFLVSTKKFQLSPILIFNVDFLGFNQTIHFNVTASDVKMTPSSSHAGHLVSMDAWFNLNQLLTRKYICLSELIGNNFQHFINQMKLSLFVYDTLSRSMTTEPIEVKVKLFSVPQHHKKHAMICTKCFLNNQEEDLDYKNLIWWAKLNKRSGFDRIVICHNSPLPPSFSSSRIAHDLNFSSSSSDSSSFVSFTQIDDVCLPPNFFNNKFNKNRIADVFNSIWVNECYLDNLDKFKYIMVNSPEDLVMPRIFSDYRTLLNTRLFITSLLSSDINANTLLLGHSSSSSSDECKLNKRHQQNLTSLEEYLAEFEDNTIGTEPESLFFQRAFYLNNDLIDKIFTSIEQFMANRNLVRNLNEMLIDVEYNRQYNFTLKITRNANELDYVTNLIKIYRSVLQQFLAKNSQQISQSTDSYDRFFLLMLSDLLPDGTGSTMHNTKSTIQIDLRQSLRSVFKSNVPYESANAIIPSDLGHLATFSNNKHLIPINQAQSILIPIKQLHLDLNYLNCYFLPLFLNL